MTHGIKSLAQDLAKHGRYGDTMVAHINPQEAALLKAMGGSGTINPTTGLPEFFGLGSIVNPIKNAVQKVVQTAYQPIKDTPFIGGAIDKGLVGLDKSIGKTIPGGWGTVGMIAASMVPGVGPLAMAGLGALNGSGVLRKDGKFNLQGALMGGAMAYGASSLASGLSAAGGGGASSLASETANIASNLGVEGAGTGIGSQAAMLAEQNAGMGLEGLNSINAGANQAIQAGQAAAQAAPGAGTDVFSGLSGTQGAVPTAPVAQPSTLSNLATGYGQNVSAAGEGIKNLVGLGEGTSKAAQAAFTGSGATLQNTALPIVVGGMGLMDIQAQEDALNQQQASGNISTTDYNAQMAKINEAKANATTAMNENPYKFAMGGTVTNPPDDQTNIANQSPIQQIGGQSSMRTLPNLGPDFSWGNMQAYQGTRADETAAMQANQAAGIQTMGGIGQPSANPLSNISQTSASQSTGNIPQPYSGGFGSGGSGSSSQGAFPLEGSYGIVKMAAGGIPRFLSGGGDGLSDDIPAIIGDKQPAKLADGEFVVSSDVVSGLGGGSSKAGAKKLYEMMDRVRKQAHGTKKQIRPVNTKALPA